MYHIFSCEFKCDDIVYRMLLFSLIIKRHIRDFLKFICLIISMQELENTGSDIDYGKLNEELDQSATIATTQSPPLLRRGAVDEPINGLFAKI